MSKNAEVIKELQQTQQQTNSKSATAQKTAKMKQRDVKQFIKEHVKDAEVEKSALVTVRERRAYRVNSVKDDNTLYNATMYYNAQTKRLELLTQKIANTEVIKFVEAQAKNTKFTAQTIMNLLKTCGGAYGDKIRKALFAVSLMTTKSEFETKASEIIEKAIANKKLCIYYDLNNDESKRKHYEFIKF